MPNANVEITLLPGDGSDAQKPPSHHIGSPPTSFRNPWPSAAPIGLAKVIETRFLRSADKTNMPVPAGRKGLVPIRKPDWGAASRDKLRATWIGHASFLVESSSSLKRGVRVIFDPVFSERTSPVQWFGPKRYSPTPCTIDELPEIDVIVISHNHYDHLDSWTIKEIWRKSKEEGSSPLIVCPLGNKPFFLSLLPDVLPNHVVELDWWDGVRINILDIGTIDLVCTPAQHTSARSYNDRDKALWSSWVMKEVKPADGSEGKNLYFSGDTGYRRVVQPNPTDEEEISMPSCPAFKEIGNKYGPFDLALLPIGLYSPRDFMSSVHCAPEDSACIHVDLKSRKSIGMHYGTVRGGISQYYEDVMEPPRRWKEVCVRKGLKWGEEVDLCDIGETVLV